MTYGLFIIAFAWGIQLFQVWKKRNDSLQPWFLRFFAIGIILVIFENFKSLKSLESWAGILSLVLVVLVLWKMKK